jgi:hypothetical protein
VVTATYNAPYSLLWHVNNRGAPWGQVTLYTLPAKPTHVAVADMTQDSVLDLVVSDDLGLRLLQGRFTNGSTTSLVFDSVVVLTSLYTPALAYIVDFNRDLVVRARATRRGSLSGPQVAKQRDRVLGCLAALVCVVPCSSAARRRVHVPEEQHGWHSAVCGHSSADGCCCWQRRGDTGCQRRELHRLGQ